MYLCSALFRVNAIRIDTNANSPARKIPGKRPHANNFSKKTNNPVTKID